MVSGEDPKPADGAGGVKRYVKTHSGWMTGETPCDPPEVERWVKAEDHAAALAEAKAKLAAASESSRLARNMLRAS